MSRYVHRPRSVSYQEPRTCLQCDGKLPYPLALFCSDRCRQEWLALTPPFRGEPMNVIVSHRRPRKKATPRGPQIRKPQPQPHRKVIAMPNITPNDAEADQ